MLAFVFFSLGDRGQRCQSVAGMVMTWRIAIDCA